MANISLSGQTLQLGSVSSHFSFHSHFCCFPGVVEAPCQAAIWHCRSYLWPCKAPGLCCPEVHCSLEHAALTQTVVLMSEGKSAERPVLAEDQIERNVAAIGALLQRLLGQGSESTQQALIVNNLDWFGDMPLLTFLRKVRRCCH